MKKILRRYTYRLKPTPDQAHTLNKWFGSYRYAWNQVVAENNNRNSSPSLRKNFSNSELCTFLKNLRNSTLFLKEVHSHVFSCLYKNYLRSWDMFFEDVKLLKAGVKKKLDFCPPKLKSRFCKNSFQLSTGCYWNGKNFQQKDYNIDKVNSRLHISKLGWIRFIQHREITGELKDITVFKKNDKYYFSVTVEREIEIPAYTSYNMEGIDFGVSKSLTVSDGRYFDIPDKVQELTDRINKMKSRRDRKQKKGSKRFEKTTAHIRKLQEKVNNVKTDFRHKVSHTLSDDLQIAVCEDLNIGNMTKSAKGTILNPGSNVKQKSGLNREILNQGWGEVRSFLQYKLDEKGGYLIKIPPQYTSQTCSNCGCIDKQSRKSQSKYHCTSCGFEINADLNASINIRTLGQRVLASHPVYHGLLAKCSWRGKGLERLSVKRELILAEIC